jgi:hypothetical protein
MTPCDARKRISSSALSVTGPADAWMRYSFSMSRTLALTIRWTPRPTLLRTVEIPNGSHRSRWSSPSNHAPALAGAQWPLFCHSVRMDHNELRARIRQLMASGDLPAPLGHQLHPGQVVRVTRVVIGRSTWGPCLICGEADPRVSYTYADRKIVRLHAACDALWRLEREAQS